MQLSELDAHRRTVATRSGQISYIDIGTGPVALFVHGIATNAFLWRHVIGALTSQRRCIAVDLPLHGRSPVTEEQDLSLAALAAGLDDFCEALGLTGIDLVANDTGGPSPRSSPPATRIGWPRSPSPTATPATTSRPMPSSR